MRPSPRAARLLSLLSLLSAAACPVGDATPDAGAHVHVDAGPEGPWRMPSLPVCETGYASAPETAGQLAGRQLVEISGLVASRRNPGVLWGHNDSGDGARLIAFSTTGEQLLELRLPGASFRDAEDLALAACPAALDSTDGPCLWLADVGDNNHVRDGVSLFVTPEPVLDPDAAPTSVAADRWLRVPFTYDTGAADVEAVVVEPDGARVVLYEKTPAPTGRIFSLEGDFDGTELVATTLGLLASPAHDTQGGGMITAADLHPTTRRIVLRTYTGVFEYALPSGISAGDIGGIEPSRVATNVDEPQGESIAYDEAGTGIWTVSESTNGAGGQPLHFFGCE